jgi:hypothetical protein
MSLPSRLLGANPSIQVSTLLSGSLSTPSAKQNFIETDFEAIQGFRITNSTTASFDFTSIPQTYKHLQIRLFGQGLTSDDAIMRINNDSSSNYSWHELRGNRSAAGTSGTANIAGSSYIGRIPVQSLGANYFGVLVCDIPDYTSTVRTKMFHSSIAGVDYNTGGVVGTMSGIYPSTSAITRLTISLQGGFWSPFSECGLYGLKGN